MDCRVKPGNDSESSECVRALVQAGQEGSAFDEAHERFVERLFRELSVLSDRFFIVPGNHDLDRSAVSRARFIELGLKAQLESAAAINSFVDQVLEGSHETALDRLNAYQDYVARRLNAGQTLSNPFLNVDKFKIDGAEVAVARFNTAWRATGEGGRADTKNLVIGERIVDLATQCISDADVRLAVFHHPLDG